MKVAGILVRGVGLVTGVEIMAKEPKNKKGRCRICGRQIIYKLGRWIHKTKVRHGARK